MPTKAATASRSPKKREEPPQVDESIYEPRPQAPGSQFFAVKLFVIAGLVILLFWFMNKTV
jgi:hypothetical protein